MEPTEGCRLDALLVQRGLASGREKAKELLQYNLAVMRYNDDCYPLLMPCGEIRVEEIPEDDRSIFS